MIAYYIILALLSLMYSTYLYFTRTFDHWKKKGINGPDPVPIFGNLKDSFFRHKHVAVTYKEIYDEYPKEKYVGIYRMASPSLVIRDLELVKQILIKDFEVFSYRGINLGKDKLGDNVFHADQSTWKALRPKISSKFTSEKLKNGMYIFLESGDKLVNFIENTGIKSGEQEMISLFRKYTIATIMAFAFGIKVDTFYENSKLFDKIDKSLFEHRSILNEIASIFSNSLENMNNPSFGKLINKFCYEIIKAITQLKGGKFLSKSSVIDSLLKEKQDSEIESTKAHEKGDQVSFEVTDHVIAGQVFFLYGAGYGNNSIVLSNAMYHIAKNPDIQNKLVEEIDSVLKKYSGELKYEALKEMKYLDSIFDETLRMHPTVNSIMRCTVRDYKIPGTKVTIQKGTTVVISPLAIHHDKNIHSTPDKFIPERFTPENLQSRHFCAYLPFGAGPRMCAGILTAKVQFKVGMIKFLSRFRVEPSERMDNIFDYNPRRFQISREGGIYLNIIPRK